MKNKDLWADGPLKKDMATATSSNASKVALAMIVKGSKRHAELLDRCLKEVEEDVDGIFITATYVDDEVETEPVVKVAEKYGAKVSFYKWNNHFADARNYNFSQVTNEYDWIMWLDADDIYKPLKKNAIRKSVQYANEKNYDGVTCWYLYDFDEFKNCTVKHMKTRIIRNDGSVEWSGALHEGFKENRQVSAVLAENHFEILHIKDDEDKNESAARNYKITKEEIKNTPDDPRTYWNHGAACLAVGRWQESLDALKKFVDMSESDEERYIAFQRMAIALDELGETGKAMDMTMRSIAIRPKYPDAYLQAGNFAHKKEEWDKAKEFLVMGLAKPKPKREIIFFNPRDYDFNPAFKLAHAYVMLGQYKEALNLIDNVCLKMYPTHDKAKRFRVEIKKEVDRMEEVEQVFKELNELPLWKKILNKLGFKMEMNKDKLLEKIDSLEPEIRSHPAISYFYNQNFQKTQTTGKEIAIYCGETDFTWNPDSLKTGRIGGSEEAVIHMSRLLANYGFDVTVYASTGQPPMKYGKVMWKPNWMFNPKDTFDILIAWRHPLLFNHDINAKYRVVWLHDVIQPAEFTKKRLMNIDKVFVLSKYHRSLFPNIPEEKILITGNGIDKGDFDRDDIKKKKAKFIWTSSYDRGLHAMLELWPMIKERLPEATLDIYYGWGLFENMYKHSENKMKWKENVQKMIDELPGVTEHGKISPQEIAEKYLEADVWAYPTEFPEIYCISAIKAQAANCTPVTTHFAALKETAPFGLHVETSSIYTNEKDRRDFVGACVKAVKDNRYPELKMSDWAMEQTWDKIAEQWYNLFKNYKQ